MKAYTAEFVGEEGEITTKTVAANSFAQAAKKADTKENTEAFGTLWQMKESDEVII